MTDHPDRVWPLQGASNFRDLGGYPGHDGRPVRWRRLFRSDHLGGLTEADKAQLVALGLARSFDFRGEAERAAVGYQLPGLTQHSLAIEPTVVQRMQDLVDAGQSLTPAHASELMAELYRALVNDQSHRFAELFEHLLTADAPVVFHCTAGKDRTGFAAALVLLALGVPRDVVQQDYLLTNRVFKHPASTQHTLVTRGAGRAVAGAARLPGRCAAGGGQRSRRHRALLAAAHGPGPGGAAHAGRALPAAGVAPSRRLSPPGQTGPGAPASVAACPRCAPCALRCRS